MNIGFDAKRLYNNFTGLGNYSRFIIDALEKFYPQHDYFLFTPKIKLNRETDRYVKSEKLKTITPSSFIKKTGLGSLWRTFGLASQMQQCKLDLYHGLSHELPYAIPKNIRAVVTIHDLIFLKFPELYKNIDRKIYTAKVKHACDVSDAIICISQQTADDVQEFFKPDPSKIKIVAQGCHENFTREISGSEIAEIKKKYNLPDQFILNVGTIEVRKNVLLILKALKILGNKVDMPLVIMGRATHYLDTIKKFAADNGLEKKVIYLHGVAFHDFPAVYKLSSAFVYPSVYEGFGIPLIEAIACGVPVITSSGSCFNETAGPSSIYINPHDADELSFQLDRVLQNSFLRQQMITESAAYIKRFEPQAIARDMMGVYDEVVKK